ncbi:MAG TPA: xanthine dehydrogenase family protein subunit M [Acetobacteraceae bacterium]|nr:xanthine dehydrogenase family protein subunit M [Acetobacteraceae bacterium]
MYDFEYRKPASVAEAAAILAGDAEAKALAGGMTFIPVMKQRLAKPSVVVDLAGLGLTGIRREGDAIVIGAMTPHGRVADSADVKSAFPALAYLADNIGDRQVRERGTIGGSLANNDPSACYPAAALATGATIRTNRREIAAEDYFLGMFTTALEQDELITEVSLPIPRAAHYEKFVNPASRYPMVAVFVARMPGGTRVAVTGAGNNGVFRHREMEQALDREFSPEAIRDIKTPEEQMNSDIHASAPYRAHLVGVMARRAVAAINGRG